MKKILCAVSIAFTLAGCAGFQAVDAMKPADVGDNITIEPQIAWAKVQNTGSARTIWTVDGFGLDELHFITGIKPGDPLVEISGVKKADMVPYSTTMLPNDVMEMMASTMGKSGFQQVRTAGLQPAPFGSSMGFRFTFTYTSMDGLEMKGLALAAQRGGKLDVIYFLAPAEYYFDRYAPTVERLFASVKAA